MIEPLSTNVPTAFTEAESLHDFKLKFVAML